jgi:peptide/nickel transport system permease protein
VAVVLTRLTTAYGRVRSSYFIRNVVDIFQNVLSDRLTKVAFGFIIFLLLMGVFGPNIAPYDPGETQRGADGDVLRTEAPSQSHPMGTDRLGRDIFSQVLVGAQPTMLLVLVVGLMVFTIGSAVGVTAGYVGGLVDEILMRFTDFIYSVPLLPAALVLVVILESGFWTTAIVIGALIWRGMARVLRSQVLQVKERPFVMAAKSTGASTPRIIFKHIFPNVAPMAILFTAIGAGYAVIIQAGLAFLGLADPKSYTWGIILRDAYRSGAIADAWWWAVFPGLLISFTVLSLFLIGRGYEDDDVAEDMMTSA